LPEGQIFGQIIQNSQNTFLGRRKQEAVKLKVLQKVAENRPENSFLLLFRSKINKLLVVS
jgi:hypothetical protein